MLANDLIVELNAALDVVHPQIRGLDDLTRATLSSAALDIIHQEYGDHTRRRDLLGNAISAIEALLADGYPEMPKRAVSAEIFDELQVEQADIESAFAEFVASAVATSVSVSLGAAAPKP